MTMLPNNYPALLKDIGPQAVAQLRYPSDQPTIDLIHCQEKNRIVAEYALREMNKPIGISEYQLTRALPEELKSRLPTIEEIEKELGKIGGGA